MTEEQMRAECAAIQAEWQMGGLTGGVYEDFAVELARRVQAAERERWATAARLVLEAEPDQMPLALDALRDVYEA